MMKSETERLGWFVCARYRAMGSGAAAVVCTGGGCRRVGGVGGGGGACRGVLVWWASW